MAGIGSDQSLLDAASAAEVPSALAIKYGRGARVMLAANADEPWLPHGVGGRAKSPSATAVLPQR